MHFTFPWYSSRGLLIDLEAQPANLVIDAKDPSRVGWSVQSNTTLKSGLTSVSSSLSATLYIYYDVLSNTFVSEQTSAIEDKMALVITTASAPLRRGHQEGHAHDQLLRSGQADVPSSARTSSSTSMVRIR